MNPDQALEAAKAQLRLSFARVETELAETAEDLQHKVSQATAEVQERVEDTTQRLGRQLSTALDSPMRAVRKKPLEALAIAALAGWVAGTLARPRPASSPPPNRSLLEGLASGNLGKIAWDVIQQVYLTPQNLRGWITALLKPKEEPR
ncbi:MAG: hypothetical protein IVW51_01520 [Thermaceae bacterium]|nr:hypothetical protein [Thermaceae bacterium]